MILHFYSYEYLFKLYHTFLFKSSSFFGVAGKTTEKDEKNDCRPRLNKCAKLDAFHLKVLFFLVTRTLLVS